mgnify:CR=1 FL=1
MAPWSGSQSMDTQLPPPALRATSPRERLIIAHIFPGQGRGATTATSACGAAKARWSNGGEVDGEGQEAEPPSLRVAPGGVVADESSTPTRGLLRASSTLSTLGSALPTRTTLTQVDSAIAGPHPPAHIATDLVASWRLGVSSAPYDPGRTPGTPPRPDPCASLRGSAGLCSSAGR